VYNRLHNFLQKHDIFYKYQFGLGRCHSTSLALIVVTVTVTVAWSAVHVTQTAIRYVAAKKVTSIGTEVSLFV